jgi:hypothetical protein
VQAVHIVFIEITKAGIIHESQREKQVIENFEKLRTLRHKYNNLYVSSLEKGRVESIRWRKKNRSKC